MEESVEQKGSAAEIEVSSATSEVENHGLVNKNKQLLAETKHEREARRNAEAELKRLKNELLEKEGKKDELLASVRSENEDLQKKLNDQIGNFAWKTVNSEVKEALLKANCTKPEKVMKLEDEGIISLAKVMDKETLSTDKEYLNELVENAKKAHPELFTKGNISVSDVVPSNKVETKPTVNLTQIVKDDEARRSYLAGLFSKE